MAAMAEAQGSRGGGYGLSAEVAGKIAAKYDVNAERLAIEWIERVTGDAKPSGTGFGDWLHDGTVLCKLINTIQPEAVKKVEVSAMPFKQMSNVSSFLRAARTVGINETDAFETADLFEQKDLGAVVRCLSALSRAAKSNARSFNGPYLEINFSAPAGVQIESASGATGLNKRVAPSPSALNAKISTMNIGDYHHSVRPNPVAPSALNAKISTMNIGDSHPTVRKNPVVAMIQNSISGKGGPGAVVVTSSGTSSSSAASSVSSPASNTPTTVTREPVGARGGGYGLSADCAAKQAAKYDFNAERLTVQWIEAVTGQSHGNQSFGDWLHSGQVLCAVINTLQPGAVPKVETSSMPFKQMINISAFLRAARSVGVTETDCFETADLYDEKDLGAVIRCLHALSRTVHKKGTYTGATLDINFSAPAGIAIPAAGEHTGLNR